MAHTQNVIEITLPENWGLFGMVSGIIISITLKP